MTSMITLEPSETFVNSERVQAITERALIYLESGYPVHFAGSAGTGKTTLAFHVAAKLGRPVSLINGSDNTDSTDMIGSNSGYEKTTVVDNYISSVLKRKESMKVAWSNNRLTNACQAGHTLIYDEFNRTRPEVNNLMLSILSEGILHIPNGKGADYLEVHPEFRVIFTSNPEEYVGVHKMQDALMDRIATIQINPYERRAEAEIVQRRTNLLGDEVEKLVELVHLFSHSGGGVRNSSLRTSLMLGKVVDSRGNRPSSKDEIFVGLCRDLLADRDGRLIFNGNEVGDEELRAAIDEVFQEQASAPKANSSTKKPKAPITRAA